MESLRIHSAVFARGQGFKNKITDRAAEPRDIPKYRPAIGFTSELFPPLVPQPRSGLATGWHPACR